MPRLSLRRRFSDWPLRRKMILGFLAVIGIGGVVSLLLGTRLEHRTIVSLAQAKVRHDLSSAWMVYNDRLRSIGDAVRLSAAREFLRERLKKGRGDEAAALLNGIRRDFELDILTLTDAAGRVVLRSRRPLIAGDDRGGDAFGALAFTRVFGQAWEMHGEAAWREHEAVLIGGKYTTANGITFIGEFFTPPNIAYYRDMSISPLAGRQNYLFLDAGKNRLRELPGWKEWDLSAYMVTNLNDRSFTVLFDANRRFGKRFSSYLHLQIPAGSSTSDYGATPYSAATSIGVRFQL